MLGSDVMKGCLKLSLHFRSIITLQMGDNGQDHSPASTANTCLGEEQGRPGTHRQAVHGTRASMWKMSKLRCCEAERCSQGAQEPWESAAPGDAGACLVSRAELTPLSLQALRIRCP